MIVIVTGSGTLDINTQVQHTSSDKPIIDTTCINTTSSNTTGVNTKHRPVPTPTISTQYHTQYQRIGFSTAGDGLRRRRRGRRRSRRRRRTRHRRAGAYTRSLLSST